MQNFWNEDHPLSAVSNYFSETLMPAEGKCDTLQGELFRASSKISYDWYNNGWGCNNWSGAVVFLCEHFNLPNCPDDSTLDRFYKALRDVSAYSHGEPTNFLLDDRAECLVTTIHEIVVQAILDNPVPIANDKDMWDYSEPDAPYEDDYEEDEE